MFTNINKRLNPFAPFDVLEGMSEAAVEQEFSKWDTLAIQAMHASFYINMVAYFGLFLKLIKTLDGHAVTLQNFWVADIWMKVGILVVAWGVLMFFRYISQYQTRFVVRIIGFSISLKPGQLIRNYVYQWETKVYLLGLGVFGMALMFIMWFYGVKGYLQFFLPQNAVTFEPLVLAVIAVSYVVASVIFPATTIDPQDKPELLELLVTNNVIFALRMHERLYSQVIKIAAPRIAVEALNVVKEKGLAGMMDWAIVPKDQWNNLARNLAFSRQLLGDAREIRQKTIAGEDYLLLTGSDGNRTLHSPESLRSVDPHH